MRIENPLQIRHMNSKTSQSVIFECSNCADAKEQAAIWAENVRLEKIAVAEKARVLAEHNRLLAEADEARRKKQMLSDNEFYNETCTGAETRIL